MLDIQAINTSKINGHFSIFQNSEVGRFDSTYGLYVATPTKLTSAVGLNPGPVPVPHRYLARS